jgi:hypothetical protein
MYLFVWNNVGMGDLAQHLICTWDWLHVPLSKNLLQMFDKVPKLAMVKEYVPQGGSNKKCFR